MPSLVAIAFGMQYPLCCLAQADNDRDGSMYENVAQYAKSVTSLNASYQEHLKTRELLADEFNQIYSQFATAGQEAQAIAQRAQAEFQTWIQAISEREAARSQLDQLAKQSQGSSGNTSAIERGTTATRLRNNAIDMNSEVFRSEQRANQLQLAQSLNAQRQQKLQEELAKLGVKAQAWSQAEFQLVRQYLAVADLANTRSDLELKSARRWLESELESHADNVGAKLALAITLMRSQEFDDSRDMLDGLVKHGGVVKLFASAARAELLVDMSEERLAKRDLSIVRSVKLPEVLVLQARTFFKLREFKQAELLWESLSKSSEFEAMAHCRTALGLLARRATQSQIKRAINEAQLAIDLSGGDDWHCHLTSAVCLAANADKDAAIAACQRAAELAIGNKKQLCLEICDQIRLGKDVVWQY